MKIGYYRLGLVRLGLRKNKCLRKSNIYEGIVRERIVRG